MSNYIEHRPWGSFENLLDTDYCKVKRIIVKLGQRLSYQYHHERTNLYGSEDVINIPVRMKHRVENDGEEDLIFIETQTGSYFGEDDIVRLDDDYGRNK